MDNFENQIICGDCIRTMEQIPQNMVDLVVTSPPYNVGTEYDVYRDRLPYHKYLQWCTDWLAEIYRVLKMDGRLCLNHYLSCGDAKFRFSPLMDLNAITQRIGFQHHGLAIWDDRTLSKRTAWGSWLSASAPYVNSPYEGILILYKRYWKKSERGISTIERDEFMEACSGTWKIQPVARKTRHPADFPIELPRRCINLLSYKGDLVVDPFVGSGTTCVAAKEAGRRYIGMDVSKAYCEVARRRLDETDDGS